MSAYMDLGIDLGTTNSCVARSEGDTVRIFQNNDLMNVTPSVVRIVKNGRIIVGKRAYNAVVDDPANVAAEFKRLMGQKDKRQFPASGREMSPEELSAEVLKALREDVQRATGKPVVSAVITVPAAFGALQCDATARAGRLAGIEECSLLQEPIAAAIAYGATPHSRDQRWLVYDLGGGTLDVAVCSTREGRLSVLEHRGDNLLGGKDIDRKLVEGCLLPALAQSFALPDPAANPGEFQLLMRRLALKAEEAKIALTSEMQTVVSLFEIGEDRDGKAIELDIPLSRADLERLFEPIMQRTMDLADEALAGARIQGKDLNRILLVGGPTQMPYLRRVLSEHLNAPVDHSLDPMTVVARGAAMYAATVEIASTSAPRRAAAPGTVAIQLAYEPVSSTLETPIAGKVVSDGGSKELQVRIESQAGYWTSGWIPVTEGYFEVNAVLQENKLCPFYIYVRDASGTTLPVEPSEFTVRQGMPLAAPPLPHTISIEVVRPNGRVELDPILPRNTPLPAEKRIQYRADRTLRPGEQGTALTVKLWEGEDLTEPEANEWIGNVQISSSMIRRPVPEDSEIELFIRIDTSRLITVEIFIPHLNQHISEGLYLAEQTESGQSDMVKVTKEVEVFTDRLAILREHLEERGDSETEATLKKVRRELEDLDIELAKAVRQSDTSDPDQTRRVRASARELRTQISSLERRVGVDRFIAKRSEQAQRTIQEVLENVEKYGDKVDHYEFEMLRKQLDQAAERVDERGVQKCIAEMDQLNLRVLFRQDWFWRTIFETMDKSDGAFSNPKAAQHWVVEGERAIQEGNGQTLREAVRKLWALQPVPTVEAAQQRAARTGLRA